MQFFWSLLVLVAMYIYIYTHIHIHIYIGDMFDTCTFVSHMSHPGAVEKMRFGRKLALQALGLASDPMEGVRRFFYSMVLYLKL